MDQLPQFRRRRLFLGAVVPTLFAAGAWLLIAAWWPSLPSQVAIHWGPGGTVAYGTPSRLLLPIAIATGASLIVLAPVAVRVGKTQLERRLFVAIAMAVPILMSFIAIDSVYVNLPFAVFSQPGIILAFGAVVAIGAGIAAGFSSGTDPTIPATVPVGATNVTEAEDSPAKWVTHERASTTFIVLMLGAVASVAVLMPLAGMTMLGIALGLPMAAFLFIGSRTTITIDDDGLVASYRGGLTMARIAAIEITHITVETNTDPVNQFGGWGYRSSLVEPGTTGIIMRRGAQMRIDMTAERAVVVAINDAAEAAGHLLRAARATRTDRHAP